MKKLYVGNLPYQATDSELSSWMSQQAGIAFDSVSVVRDQYSGESRGFGFAEISNDDDAQKAIQACNGKDFLGRTLVVNEARPPRSAGGGFGGGRGAGGGGGGRPGGGGGRGRGAGGGGGNRGGGNWQR